MSENQINTERYDFFWKPESNRVHPSEIDSKCVSVELPAGLAPWAALMAAHEQGTLIPFGSARTGIHEVQTDGGIWTRQGCNKREASVWTFASWDDLDAAE